MERAIHTFNNGVRVYDDHLLEEQRERYRKHNVHESEEENIFVDLIRRIPARGCFVDVGAAIGYYLILARKLAPDITIHAVEPLARHRSFLRENVALNGLSDNDFTVYAECLTSTVGNERFMDRGFGSRLPRNDRDRRISLSTRWKRFLEKMGLRRPKPGSQVLIIPTITLDLLVGRIGRPVDLLQIDVQGLEIEVLKGGMQSMATGSVRTFLIGTHGLPIHQECIARLRDGGYAIEIDHPDTTEQPDGIIVACK